MPLLGSHLSIAGGYDKAADAAAALGMQTVQLFTKNNNQWRAKDIADDEAARFRDAVERGGLVHPCAHSSYLINLASGDELLWQKSLDAFVIELERATTLGLDGVVVHPGSAVALTEEQAIARIVAALDEALRRTDGLSAEVWLETTAGQGSSVGHRFEQLAAILAGLKDSRRVGVCVDTCHIFAAGYPLASSADYADTIRRLDESIGLARVRAFHLNDSKKDLGSRVDRHEHIGEGKLGVEPFRHLMNDPRFASLPMYLETPKGNRDGEPLDAINLRTLRGLVPVTGSPAPKRPRKRPVSAAAAD